MHKNNNTKYFGLGNLNKLFSLNDGGKNITRFWQGVSLKYFSDTYAEILNCRTGVGKKFI